MCRGQYPSVKHIPMCNGQYPSVKRIPMCSGQYPSVKRIPMYNGQYSSVKCIPFVYLLPSPINFTSLPTPFFTLSSTYSPVSFLSISWFPQISALSFL